MRLTKRQKEIAKIMKGGGRLSRASTGGGWYVYLDDGHYWCPYGRIKLMTMEALMDSGLIAEVEGIYYGMQHPKVLEQQRKLAERLERESGTVGVRVSNWIPEDHAAMIVLEGSDPEDCMNRVAFIEKTPRVQVTGPDDLRLGKKPSFGTGGWWVYGPGGCANTSKGSQDGYGFYPPSREWCEESLLKLGYLLPWRA